MASGLLLLRVMKRHEIGISFDCMVPLAMGKMNHLHTKPGIPTALKREAKNFCVRPTTSVKNCPKLLGKFVCTQQNKDNVGKNLLLLKPPSCTLYKIINPFTS